MSQSPPRLHTSREDLDAMDQRILALPDEAVVRVSLVGGACIEGVVAARPTMEAFRDAEGIEGHNALLRLDDLAAPEVPHYLWVGDITAIERLGSA